MSDEQKIPSLLSLCRGEHPWASSTDNDLTNRDTDARPADDAERVTVSNPPGHEGGLDARPGGSKPCPVCGATDHETFILNGVTVRACPDLPTAWIIW